MINYKDRGFMISLISSLEIVFCIMKQNNQKNARGTKSSPVTYVFGSRACREIFSTPRLLTVLIGNKTKTT